MNKLRDIIYNISDILVTLIIIAAALLLISWRVSAIMDYGSQEDISSDTQIENNADDGQSDSGSADGDISDDDSSNGEQNEPATGDVSFTVSSNQSADSIGQALTDAGLVSDKQTFISAVNAADAATRLKTGTFTIPAGSTPEQIVAILTK